MKYLNQILATIFSLPYVVFGANYFLNFIPMPAPTADNAGNFGTILYTTKFLLVVKIMELLFGAMILLNVKRALALILITPITVNILMIELFIAHKPGIGVAMILLNFILLLRYRAKYQSIIS